MREKEREKQKDMIREKCIYMWIFETKRSDYIIQIHTYPYVSCVNSNILYIRIMAVSSNYQKYILIMRWWCIFRMFYIVGALSMRSPHALFIHVSFRHIQVLYVRVEISKWLNFVSKQPRTWQIGANRNWKAKLTLMRQQLTKIEYSTFEMHDRFMSLNLEQSVHGRLAAWYNGYSAYMKFSYFFLIGCRNKWELFWLATIYITWKYAHRTSECTLFTDMMVEC